MKKIILLIILLPSILFSNDLIQTETEDFIFNTEAGVTILTEVIEISQDLDSILDKTLKLKSGKDIREIVILKDLSSYKTYIRNMDIAPREDYIFIRYSNQKSKIVIYQSDEILKTSLRHHLVLQYIEHFTNGSPYWLTLGLATYFEDLNSNKWINTLRRSNSNENIFTVLMNSDKSNIKPYFSWILVDYLLNCENSEHHRLLWDTLSYLKWSEDENKTTVITDEFIDANLDKSILDYLNNIKGYEDYMDTAIKLYKDSNYKLAIENLNSAINLEPQNYSPEYYLGLSYSGLKEYSKAYLHFSNALGKGAPEDIVYYSIGINFFTNNEFEKSKKYLNKIKDEVYQGMANEVLNEIAKY